MLFFVDINGSTDTRQSQKLTSWYFVLRWTKQMTYNTKQNRKIYSLYFLDSETNVLDLGQVRCIIIAADLKNIYNVEINNE
jgi:hypothetical protein